MNVKDSGLLPLLTDAVSDADLPAQSIPSIDLYLDQIISLVSECNAQGSDRYADRVLTKTMINNYSKEGLINPIKGKKYTREQVLQILYIYALKSTLSIGEIKRLLYGIYHSETDFDGEALGECYDRFLDIKESNRQGSIEVLETLIQKNGLDLGNERDYFLTVLGALSLSAYLKAIAQAMLETRYPDPAAEERSGRETQMQEKHRREEQERIRRARQEQKGKADRGDKQKSNGGNKKKAAEPPQVTETVRTKEKD